MWILERQGTEYNDKREFSSLEEAQEVMESEYEERIEDGYDQGDCDNDHAFITDHEYFQAWDIYEKKDDLTPTEKIFNEIYLQFNRIDNGVEQYAWELQDTGVITYHVDNLRKMVDKLKEMM
jgi:hypothetical protein